MMRKVGIKMSRVVKGQCVTSAPPAEVKSRPVHWALPPLRPLLLLVVAPLFAASLLHEPGRVGTDGQVKALPRGGAEVVVSLLFAGPSHGAGGEVRLRHLA